MGERSSPSVAPNLPAPPSPGDSFRAKAIYAAQVREIYQLSRLAYAGALLCAMVVITALWGVVAPHVVMLWATAILGVTVGHYLLYRTYLRRNPPIAEARRWGTYFIVGAFVSGALWGLLGSALYPFGSMPHELLVVVIIGGLVVSAVFVLAPVHQAFLAFLIPATLPIILTVFLQSTTGHFYLAALLLVFLVVMIGTGPLISNMIRDAIGTRLEKDELAAKLSDTHAAAKFTNLQLEERVYAERVMAEELRQASQKLGALIEASPLAIIVFDVQGRVERSNWAAEKIFGWTQEELHGKPGPPHPPGRESEAEELRRKILDGETVLGVETLRVRKDGKVIDVSLSASLVRDIVARPTGYLTMFADITERKRVEKQRNVMTQVTLLLSQAQSVEDAIPRVLETVCESFGFVYGASWVLDKQNVVLRCAETWCLPRPELNAFREHSKVRLERPGNPEGLIPRIWSTCGPVWLRNIETVVTLERRTAALQAGLRSAFGLPIMVGGEFYGVLEFFAREVRRPDDTVMQVTQNVSAHIGQFIARTQAERNLQFVASHDALTGLFNRSMFSQRLQQALAQAHRHERRLAVLFIDLDGFKLINDKLGHDAGDVLLADLAIRLRECMREGDTLGRMGGDEFVVLIEGYNEDAQLLDVARKVVDTVAQPFNLRGGSHRVTASIGIAAYPQDGDDASELLKNADIAMYGAKEQGKNNFQFYSPEMNTHLVERVSLESALRRALERGELTLYYQPRVNVRENRVSGVEALVRWLHPTQGMLHPSEFMPIAEDAGLFNPIGIWVFHAACAQLKAWQQSGVSGLRIAVNLSMRQFAQDNLVEHLREAVHHAGVEPKYLEIEITEGSLMRHAERAAKLLAQVKDMGAQIVVDDFGTGYSSLGVLKRFPIDAIKIDRSLVSQLPNGADAVEMASAVIAMAHRLNLQVTAEGVETRAQWDFLSEHGCDAIQGKYYCAPAPADSVTAMLLQQPHGAVRIANVQQFRPWPAPRPGGET